MCVSIASASLILPLSFRLRMDMSDSIVSVICCDAMGVTTCYRIACGLLLRKRAPKAGLMRAGCVCISSCLQVVPWLVLKRTLPLAILVCEWKCCYT